MRIMGIISCTMHGFMPCERTWPSYPSGRSCFTRPEGSCGLRHLRPGTLPRFSWQWTWKRRQQRALMEGQAEPAGKETQQGRFERTLLRAWHRCASPRPPIKEIRECLAFHRCTRRLLGDKTLLVDAAGGHGGIALAFLASGRIKQAIVADIYQPKGFSNLRAAWAPDALIQHRHVDLRCAGWLRQLLAETGVEAVEAAVTACHTCGVLADELIQECLQAHVSFAIVPCCHGEKARSMCLDILEPFVCFQDAQGARGESLRKLAKAGLCQVGLSFLRG